MTVKAKPWDLSPLVPSTKLDDIKALMDKAVKDAEEHAAKYKGKITDMDAKALNNYIKRGEKLWLAREGPFRYASLSYSANSLDETAKKLADLARRLGTKIAQILAYEDIELSKLVAAKPELIEHPDLVEYSHTLERYKRRAPHMLSEIEEQWILQKDRFGINAWQQLQGDWLSTRMFHIEIDGKMREMPYGEIIALYEHPNRELRKAANSVVYTNLGEDEIVWASALRAIVGDHIEVSKCRKWLEPRSQSLIDNDVDSETIDALMSTIEDNADLYRRYLNVKAKIMGLPKLGNWDIVAPLPGMPERNFTWEEAKRLVVDVYKTIDDQLADIVIDMFKKNRIDGEVRKGKRSGAFFSRWHGGKSGFILCSFNGNLGDVFTLAHENGHAVHGTLMFRDLSPLNTDISYGIAEVGSTFGELLLADNLISAATTDKEKIEVLARILDEFGMATFQVSARYFFETYLYEAFEQGEYLDGETIAKYWVKGRDKIYGNAIEWLPEMKWEWTMKQHYYLANFRYYNWPYVFAQLFVFALYRLYKEEGKTFALKLKRILSSGSTISPRALAAELGFDITKKEFWTKGMEQAKDFIEQIEALS
ncbi:MAG: M3 family metallopeptidase [Candidatus Hodarchaeota archaeon]